MVQEKEKPSSLPGPGVPSRLFSFNYTKCFGIFGCSTLVILWLQSTAFVNFQVQSVQDLVTLASSRDVLRRDLQILNDSDSTASRPSLAVVDTPIADVSKVRVWKPPSTTCNGQFVFPKPKQSPKTDYDIQPTLMLREAAVDLRHNSIAELKAKYRLIGDFPLRRIAIQVSAVRGVKPVLPLPEMIREDNSKSFPEVSLTADGAKNFESEEGWRTEIDFIIDNPVYCTNRCFNADRKNKSHSACAGNEWQVIVTIAGPSRFHTDEELQEGLEELQRENDYSVRLDLSLPFKHVANGNIQNARLSMSLGCVYGLSTANALPTLLPNMPPRSSCRKSQGSVLVAGSPLHGAKRLSARRREIAHFAARALLGSIRFDTIAVGVISNYSISEIHALCKDETCRARYHAKNEQYMGNLSLAVEDELFHIGVPEALWKRIALFPVCRLGTDFRGYGKDINGCKWSAFSGQWTGNDLAYTLLSPYHKWYASFDLDEFAVNEGKFLKSEASQHRRADSESAAELFDRRDIESENPHPGSLQIGWLDFHLGNRPGHGVPIRNISREFVKYGGLEFVDSSRPQDRGVLSNRTSFWQQGPARLGACGKAVISCKSGGFGIHVHNSLSLKRRTDLSSRGCNLGQRSNFDSHIALYHGSTFGHGARFGVCNFNDFA